MAVRAVEKNGHPTRSDIKQFLCMTVDDINGLPREGVYGTLDADHPEDNEPCGIGSTAIVKTGEMFMLWSDNEWTPF